MSADTAGALIPYEDACLQGAIVERTDEEERESEELRSRDRARDIVCRFDPERLRRRREELT